MERNTRMEKNITRKGILKWKKSLLVYIILLRKRIEEGEKTSW